MASERYQPQSRKSALMHSAACIVPYTDNYATGADGSGEWITMAERVDAVVNHQLRQLTINVPRRYAKSDYVRWQSLPEWHYWRNSVPNEMIDRVAKALRERACPGRWDAATEDEKAQFRLDARAAIAALRELSPDLDRIGFDASASFESEKEDFGNGWRAVIDAILAA